MNSVDSTPALTWNAGVVLQLEILLFFVSDLRVSYNPMLGEGGKHIAVVTICAMFSQLSMRYFLLSNKSTIFISTHSGII